MKKNVKKIGFMLLMTIVFVFTALFTITTFAENEYDAMDEIEAYFDTEYLVGDKYLLKDDGYIGIPVELTTYYDVDRFGSAKTGYYGTNIVLYFVNTNIERVGTESDVNIIGSMLDRGYAVVVVDYLNNPKAKSPALDWSSQVVRKEVLNGNCFSDKTVFPSGTYRDTYVVPAGYDVTPFANFWSLDKHGAEGSLERIVDVWNTDFRSSKGNTVIEWIREETNENGDTVYVKKATQTAFDGSDPQWYSDAKGSVSVDSSSADAKYIKIKHTLALDITDCVAKDGTALDLDLDMHIVYPVKPEKAVPVMTLCCSAGYLTNAQTSADTRAQHIGYVFNGYAGVIYEHLWVPMARDEYYSSFDGSAKNNGVSKDGVSYGVYSYNSQRVDTAAVRYVKYLTYTEPEKYSFDTDSVGVMGNSKGGMFNFIGSKELKEYTTVPENMTLSEAIDARINAYVPSRIYAGKTGESRYQYGITDDYTIDGITIRGGEMQPWMTYMDENNVEREILASTSFIYAANGGNLSHIQEGHAPMFTAMCMEDPIGNGYSSSNQIANAAKNMNIPCVYFVVDIGHTFTYGKDAYHNVDTYDALFAFSNYYLRGDAVKVIYTEPSAGLAGMDTTAPITIKFSGGVNANEITKITLKDSEGNCVNGEWTSEYGGTEWTFTHEALKGGEKYTLTVPEGLLGDNGKAIEEAYIATYITENESSDIFTTVRTEKGVYFTASYTDMSAASEAKIRFSVENDAANAAGLYLVNNFNAESPDSSTVGALIEKVYLVGSGYYEINVSSVVGELSEGESVTMLLKSEKSAGKTTKVINFADEMSALGNYKYMITESSEAPDGTKAAKITLTTNVASDGTYQYLNGEYYPANASIVETWRAFINGNQKLQDSDMGRQFTATLRVYDTISRPITISMNNATSASHETLDFDYVLFTQNTKANDWTEIVVDYTVYEKVFGAASNQGKRFTVTASGDGVKESPIYIESLTIVETVTEVEFGEVSLVLDNRDTNAYKKAESTSPFAIGNQTYATLNEAMSTYNSGSVIELNSNYTFTDADNSSLYGNFENVIIDLNGYKIYSDSSYSTFTLGSGLANGQKTTLTVKNGSIFTGNAPIIGYSDTYTSGKAFDVVFDNVSLFATDMSVIKKVMSEVEIANGAEAKISVTLNDCLVKIEKEKLVKNPITIFPSGTGELDISYVINGGKIATDTFVRVNFCDNFRDVTLEEVNGTYTAIEVPECRSIPEIWACRKNDIGVYAKSSSENGIATLETVTNPNATKYGIIPTEYADAEEYPFVVFDTNGEFYGAFSQLLGEGGKNAVMGTLYSMTQDNAYSGTSYSEDAVMPIVLVRQDYTLSTSEYFNNLALLQAEVLIDLNGFTITQANSWNAIFNAATKGWSGAAGTSIFPTTIKVINGTLLTYKTGIVVMSTWESIGNGAIAGKNFNFIFDDVTLGFAENAETAGLLTTYNNPNTTGDRTLAAPFSLTFNDCTFDLTNRNSSKTGTLFSTSTAGKFIDVDITVNGGKIIGTDLKNVDLINPAGDYTSSVIFGKGSDGKYLTLEVKSGTSVGEEIFVLDNGKEKSLEYLKTNGTTDIYGLDENPLKTQYGIIDEAYADINAYPIVAFEVTNNGSVFIGGYSEFGAATKGVVGYTGSWNKHFVILFRNHAEAKTYQDTSTLIGSVKVDLNGYTLTQSESAYLFQVNRNIASADTSTTDQRVSITIENGTIINKTSSPMFVLNYGAKCNRPYGVSFTFNNVTFILKNSNRGIFTTWEAGYTSMDENNKFYIDINAAFNDCTFDYANSASGVKMLYLTHASGYDRAVYNVTINGGTIIAKNGFSYSDFIVADGDENGRADSVRFGKGSDGLYTTLVAHAGANTPVTSDVYLNLENTEYVFAKVSQTDNEAVYRLRPVATIGIDFTPKMSITLESQLVINVYIPVNSLQKFTFNGESYNDLDELKSIKRVIDGKEYYRISLSLPANEGAKEFKLVATVDIGEKSATATFTFSIVKYCAKIIANAESTGVEKTLAKDVLAYVKEAYKYFDEFNTDEEIEKVVTIINSIIGDYKAEPVSSGDVNTASPVTAVTLNLGDKPSIRFYVSDTNIEFYSNGRKLNTVAGVDTNGTYVELDVYAYALCESITYSNGGSYHVSDYVNRAAGKDYEKLAKTFVKYTESAAEYRKSVMVTTHNYVENVVPPTCVTSGYTLYTCVDCGYSYETNHVDAHGHAFGTWYVYEEVSKTSNGVMRQNCSNCDGFNLKDFSVVSSGNFGSGTNPTDTAIYTIYEDGTLKVAGSGETYNCNWNCSKQPFIDYRDFITRVIVCDGITKLGRGSFGYLKNLEYSELSNSLTEYPANLFMDSFKVGITSYTIPANITKIQQITIGKYDQSNALFTDVYIENPNIEIVDFTNTNGSVHIFVNRFASNCKKLTLYSYGAENNVKAYADKHGFKYVDLSSSFNGEEDNLLYSYNCGTLTLTPKDANSEARLPESAPWLEKIVKTDVTKIVIEQGITNIPKEYFKGYTALTSVDLPKRIEIIGSGAFATESTCSTPLTLNIGDGLASVSADFLANRTAVTVRGFEGCALDNYSQDGVTVVLKKAFKILLIGNSLSYDAADVILGRESQLYNIIKYMVGDDVYVQIGVLYSGAKTAGWHATVAEANAPVYTFYLISDDTNGLWISQNNYTSKAGLLLDAWDVVTLQPYGEEARTGSGSSSDGDATIANTSIPKLEKFYSLSASMPYLIDYVDVYCAEAKIYYYMTWSPTQSTKLNAALYDYGKMVDVLKKASLYVGSESGRGFDGVLPVGTAIQNARSTYLALQYYVTDNDSESYYFVYGLQRDNVHMSVNTGRYIVGLSFAEILVPEELRLDSYTLPNIKDHALIGPLPLEFTTIAQLSVEKMLNTLYLTGDAQYSYTAIEGYTEEPTAKCAKEIEDLVIEAIEVSDKAALVEAILEKIEHLVPNEVKALVNIAQNMDFSNTYKDCEVEISISYGFATTVVTKIVSAKLTTPTAEIVNKNNADATVTFVIDDGNWATARFAKEMILKHSGLTVSYAVPIKQIATLKTEDTDGDGIPEYVMVDGKYVYEVNESSYSFWQDVLSDTKAEIINHSYTHGFWGTNDDGGTFEYVKNGESTVTFSEIMPKGSSTKEIYASKQILEELFPNNISINSTALSFITPGIGIKTVDHKLSDGSVVTTYKTYFNEVLKKAYDNGELIGANSTFGATYDPSLDLSTKVVTKNNFSTYENRMTIPRYMVEHYNANPDGLVNDDISNWTDYIDSAIDLNGWACFCIHMILENESASGHNITKAQAEKLFKYALDNNVWVATNTEAILYFSEWSTASVSTSYENEEINVTLTDNERDDVYNMALTVKVSVPDSWQSAVSGGSTYEVIRSADGTSYVLVDIVPDSGTVTLVQGN